MKATFESHRQGGLWQDHCDSCHSGSGREWNTGDVEYERP